MGSAGVWVTVISSIGGLSFIGTFVSALFNRRKLGADATQVLQQAAAGIVADLRTDLTATRDELKQTQRDLREAQSEIAGLRQHIGRMEDLMRQHQVPVPEFAWQDRRRNGAH